MNNDANLPVFSGRHVSVELRYESGEVERLELDVVPDAQADFDRGFLGESTPLAKAITGRRAGDTVNYQAGERARVKILAVLPEWSGAPQDLSKRREETERKAAADADTTSVMLFASSFSGKWGDYDPNAAIGPGEEEKDRGEAGDAPDQQPGK